MSNCPVCGIGSIVTETSEHSFAYGNSTLTALRTDGYCDSCGTEMIDASTARENVRNIQRAKSAHDKLLSSEEIRHFRKRFNITQKTAAMLFGGGESAFAKYESGDITHNLSMDRLLRLAMNNPNNLFDLAEMARVELDSKVIASVHQFSVENYADLIGFKKPKLDFHKVPFTKHTHIAANDSFIDDIFPKLIKFDFDFKRTATV